MKSVAQFAVDFLLVSVVAFFLLAAAAELERRDEVALHSMEKQRQVEVKAVKWRDLDRAGQYMTSFDRIGKRK